MIVKLFGVSKLKRRLKRLARVYTCQNATLLEISCIGSYKTDGRLLCKIEGKEVNTFSDSPNTSYILQYLHFRRNPLMNLYIFATVHSLMNYTNLIDGCQAHLPVQYASNIELIRQN